MNYCEKIRYILALPLKLSARVLLIYFLDKQGSNADAWPAITTICRECNMSRPTVVEATEILVKAGLLTVTKPEKPSKSKSGCNRYAVALTGKKIEPVKKPNQLKFLQSTGKDSLHQPVKNLNPNRINNGSINGSMGAGVNLEQSSSQAKAPEGTQRPKAKPVGSPQVDSEDMFGRFYSAYPKKRARKDAFKAWAKLKVDSELFEKIMDAVEKQKLSASWLKDDGKFIPYPASWLNGQRWEDEVEPYIDPIDRAIGRKHTTLEDVERLEAELGLTA